jgi:hypothetical protein
MDQLVPKSSGACYAVTFMLHISNIHNLKSIYFAYFHSLMMYGITLGSNSSDSKEVFILQKKIIRIMTGVRSCRDLFKRLQIQTFACECMYSYSLINFITNNAEHFSDQCRCTQY